MQYGLFFARCQSDCLPEKVWRKGKAFIDQRVLAICLGCHWAKEEVRRICWPCTV